MTTYTVTTESGEYPERGLSAALAADLIMSNDGHEHEIRPDADGLGFTLWTSEFSRNSPSGGRPLTKSVIYSIQDDRGQAEAEIYQAVLDNAGWWKMSVQTDADYDAMLAETADDSE